MRILATMGHPTDVNLFRNVIMELERKGHSVKIAARDKENTFTLLDNYGFNYEAGKHYKSFAAKAIGTIEIDYWLYTLSKKFNPDIFISAGSPYAAPVSKLVGKPHIAFTNTEIAKIAIRMMLPFTDVVCTPSFFKKDFGSKQIRFNSYFELAYLHPNYFRPDPSILERLNLNKNEKFIVVRFSSLKSHHDAGVKGFNFKSIQDVHEFIEELENYGRVFITSEITMDRELEKYKVKIPIEEYHNFLYFATMYIGEGAKTASEAAILGVPSIYVSTSRRGYLDELEERYGMAFTITNREQALKKGIELLNVEKLRDIWQKKRERLLSEKIDTTKFMVEFIEKYNK